MTLRTFREGWLVVERQRAPEQAKGIPGAR